MIRLHPLVTSVPSHPLFPSHRMIIDPSCPANDALIFLPPTPVSSSSHAPTLTHRQLDPPQVTPPTHRVPHVRKQHPFTPGITFSPPLPIVTSTPNSATRQDPHVTVTSCRLPPGHAERLQRLDHVSPDRAPRSGAAAAREQGRHQRGRPGATIFPAAVLLTLPGPPSWPRKK